MREGEEKGEEVKELEKKGYRLVDIVAGDVQPSQEAKHLVKKVAEKKKDTFYSDLIYNLSSERSSEEKAKVLWQEILQHKYMLSEKLGRNMGMRVAAMDYLGNIKRTIDAPKIVAESEFEKTLKLSTTDPLTGMYNRRYFGDKIGELIAFSSGNRSIFSLLMMDLDGFKGFNDREGHQAGDIILQEFSRILKECLRNTDIISRYGGDEAACLLPLTDKISAKNVGNNVREQVDDEFQDIGIKLSIGVAEFPSDAADDESLISQADAGLYRAKAFGGNAVAYFHPVTMVYKQGDPQPKEVSCIGDFNRWNMKEGRMNFNKKAGQWIASLKLLPGKYKYKFLINHTDWIMDPSQAEAADDGFGGKCSILRVKME